MIPMRKLLANQRGLTLTELIVTTAVVGMVMAGVVLVQQAGQRAYLLGSNRVEAQQNARVALDLMTRELRSARSIVTVGGGTDITFRDQCNQSVAYALAGTLLNRTGPDYSDRSNCVVAATNTRPLTGGVLTFTLTSYAVYDVSTGTYTTTTTAAQVRVIKIDLATKQEESVAAGSPGDQGATTQSTVQLRNLS